MTDPKKISDFAKEYQETYLANAQLNSALKVLRKQLYQAKYGFDINGLQPEYGEKIEVYNTGLARWQTAIRCKNGFGDYYEPFEDSCMIKPELVSHWRPFYEPELITV
jgi:hypothetical protein